MICPELPTADRPGTMAPCARQIQSLRDLGLTIDVVDMHGTPKLKYLKAVPKVRRLANKVDLVHAHFGYCGWLGRLAPLLSGSKAPLIVSFMGSDLLGSPYNPNGDLERFSKLMIRANRVLASHARHVIVKSRQMADVIAPVPSTVIANGVDVTTFRPMDRDAARKQLGLPIHSRYVLFPGNPHDPRKGHTLARAAIEAASRQFGQTIDLLPLWRVEPQWVPVYMNACDAMVMTSLLEGSPNVVKEAMACNRPIIGVPVGDVEQLLASVQGCEFCPRDPVSIGAAIVRALDKPRVTGRDAILERGLDLESVAFSIANIYEQVLGRKVPLQARSFNRQREAS
jgi:glycosyltransferase involved in cell wall biosynthesis